MARAAARPTRRLCEAVQPVTRLAEAGRTVQGISAIITGHSPESAHQILRGAASTLEMPESIWTGAGDHKVTKLNRRK